NFDSKGAVIKIIDKMEKTSVSGTKTWNDNNNQDGIRPSSITVNLLANGRQVASKTVSASDNWQYSFDNLAAYANGQKITYTVT
ncbi:Cna B-type domain-containing protein, partial [Lactobacillus paragasseri]